MLKKFFKVALALTLCLTAFVSCATTPADVPDTNVPDTSDIPAESTSAEDTAGQSTSTQSPETTAPATKDTADAKMLLAGLDIEDYKIVVTEDDGKYVASLAKQFSSYVTDEYDVRIRVASSADGAKIGFSDNCAENSWSISAESGNVVISANPAVLFGDAMDFFLANLTAFENGGACTLDCSALPMTHKGENGDYTLVWHDEFDTGIVSPLKWSYSDDFTWKYREYMTDGDDAIYVKDGSLNMDITAYDKVPMNLTTKGKVAFTQGYIEVRLRLPSERGAWTAVWLQNDPNNADYNFSGTKYLGEIDIMESFGKPESITATLHKWYLSDNTYDHYQFDMPYGDGAKTDDGEYHVLGFYFTDYAAWCTFDGHEKYRYTYKNNQNDLGTRGDGMGGFFEDPYFLILDNVSCILDGQNEPYYGLLKEDADFPLNFSIDYIRVYQTDWQSIYYYN